MTFCSLQLDYYNNHAQFVKKKYPKQAKNWGKDEQFVRQNPTTIRFKQFTREKGTEISFSMQNQPRQR